MMKRELIQEIKLYDKAIIGGGDILFASTTIHKSLGKTMLCNGIPNNRYKDFVSWSTNARQSFRDLEKATYLNGDSQHLWHDERKYRIYGARHYLLLLKGFNPKTHLGIEKETGLYILENEEIATLLKTYFWFREQEKTPEHEKLFDVYELMMFAIKEACQIKASIQLKRLNEKEAERRKQKRLNAAGNQLVLS
jgi:uncharacterized protein (UPF0332 family)